MERLRKKKTKREEKDEEEEEETTSSTTSSKRLKVCFSFGFTFFSTPAGDAEQRRRHDNHRILNQPTQGQHNNNNDQGRLDFHR